MTYQQALNKLPADCHLSCTFGNPGEGGYSEFHRSPEGWRYEISNGPYNAMQPFVWTFELA